MRHLWALALTVLVATAPALAAAGDGLEPPVPKGAAGTFQVRALHEGDAGAYTWTSAEDVGDGFRELGDTTELLRFEWLADTEVATVEGPSTPVHAVRMAHNGWTRDAAEDPPAADETVYLAMDGEGSVGMRYNAGGASVGIGDETVFIPGHQMGDFGSTLPCGSRTALQEPGFDLSEDVLEVSCWLRGYSVFGEFKAVASMELGPYDTVVFHQGRDGAQRGESWLWFAAEFPVPVAIVVQEPERPKLFHVLRLSHFGDEDGAEPLAWRDAKGPAWPEMATAPWGAFGPAEPDWVRHPLGDLIAHARTMPDGAQLDAWLDGQPDAHVSSFYGVTLDERSDGTVRSSLSVSFLGDGESATFWHDVTRPPALLPPEVIDLLGTDPFLEERIQFAAQECEWCSPVPPELLESTPLPTLDAVRARWELLKADGFEASSWGMTLQCDYECSTLWASLSVGSPGHFVRDNAGELAGYSQSELGLGIPGSSMSFFEVDHPGGESAQPDALPTPPIVRDLLEATGLLDALDDAGVLGGTPAAGPVATATPSPFAAMDETGLSGVAVGPPGDGGGPSAAAVGAAAGGTLAVGFLAWLLWAKGGALLTLFSRLHGDRLLEHPARARIHAAIAANPGIHFSGLVRSTGKANGVVKHHLDKLVAGRIVEVTRGARITTYSLRGTQDRHVRQAAVAMTSPTRRRVLEAVARTPGTSPTQVASSLGVHPATITHHVQELHRAGLVHLARSGARTHLHATPLGAQAAQVGGEQA